MARRTDFHRSGLQAQAEAAIKDCARNIDTVGAQSFMSLFKIRLQMHQESLIDASTERFCLLQGQAREIREILRKLENAGSQ